MFLTLPSCFDVFDTAITFSKFYGCPYLHFSLSFLCFLSAALFSFILFSCPLVYFACFCQFVLSSSFLMSFSLTPSSCLSILFFHLCSSVFLSSSLLLLSSISVSSYFLHFLVLSSSPLPNPSLLVLVYFDLQFCPCLFLFLVLLCLLPGIHRHHLLRLCVDGGGGGGDEKIYVRLSVVFVFVVSVSVSLFVRRYSAPVRPVPSSSVRSMCLYPARLACCPVIMCVLEIGPPAVQPLLWPLFGHCHYRATVRPTPLSLSVASGCRQSGRWPLVVWPPQSGCSGRFIRSSSGRRLIADLSGRSPAIPVLRLLFGRSPGYPTATTVVRPLWTLRLLSGHSATLARCPAIPAFVLTFPSVVFGVPISSYGSVVPAVVVTPFAFSIVVFVFGLFIRCCLSSGEFQPFGCTSDSMFPAICLVVSFCVGLKFFRFLHCLLHPCSVISLWSGRLCFWPCLSGHMWIEMQSLIFGRYGL